MRVVLRMPSDVAAIEESVELLTRHCLAGDRDGDQVRFRLQVALAEALGNAVLRGNRGDADKGVHVVADLAADAIRIHIGDEGEGFDPAPALEPPPPESEGGRGLFLLRSLVDALQFNERGNALCMTLRRR